MEYDKLPQTVIRGKTEEIVGVSVPGERYIVYIAHYKNTGLQIKFQDGVSKPFRESNLEDYLSRANKQADDRIINPERYQLQKKREKETTKKETNVTATPKPTKSSSSSDQSNMTPNLLNSQVVHKQADSVPVKYCGKPVAIRALPEQVEIYFEGTRIASHQRCFLRHQSVYQMEHYLPLLEQKGRAIFQARPVRDNVPEYFLDWLKKQEYRPKELVAKLRLYQELGADAVMRGETSLMQVPALEIEDLVCVSASVPSILLR